MTETDFCSSRKRQQNASNQCQKKFLSSYEFKSTQFFKESWHFTFIILNAILKAVFTFANYHWQKFCWIFLGAFGITMPEKYPFCCFNAKGIIVSTATVAIYIWKLSLAKILLNFPWRLWHYNARKISFLLLKCPRYQCKPQLLLVISFSNCHCKNVAVSFGIIVLIETVIFNDVMPKEPV